MKNKMNTSKNMYRIFTYEGGKETEIKRAELDNDEEVIRTVVNMNLSSHKTFYWEHLHDTGTVQDDGSVKHLEPESTDHIFWKHKNQRETWGVWERIVDFFWKSYYRLNDWKYEIVYAFERVFKKYDRRAAWDIETFVLDGVRYNTLRLIKYGHGVPQDYREKARKLLRNMTNDEVKESFKTEVNSNTEEISVADALWRTDLQGLVDDIDLLRWYERYGSIDEDEIERIMPDTHLVLSEYPIPKLKDSNEINYEKTMELHKKTNDRIFDFLKNNIGKMWD